MNVLVINGPNLNLLGKREKSIYGDLSLKEIETRILTEFSDFKIDFIQSNFEGEIVEAIQNGQDRGHQALIINPGALTHTSLAICDALRYFKGYKIEVHLSNTSSRESYRRVKITSAGADIVIEGAGIDSYLIAFDYLKRKNC